MSQSAQNIVNELYAKNQYISGLFTHVNEFSEAYKMKLKRPSMTKHNRTYLNLHEFDQRFVNPYILSNKVATPHFVEYKDVPINSCTFGNNAEVDLTGPNHMIIDIEAHFYMPESRATTAFLPQIIVSPHPDHRLANGATVNGGSPFNFGTGSTEGGVSEDRILVKEGFVYSPTNAATPADPYSIVIDGKRYRVESGAVRYTYVDEHGEFIAGPDGRSELGNVFGVVGLGAGTGDRVSIANKIRYTSLPGFKLIKLAELLFDSSDVDKVEPLTGAVYRHDQKSLSLRNALDVSVGQEVPVKAKGSLYSGRGAFAFGKSGPRTSDAYQATNLVTNGPQTPKDVQPKQTWNVPLLFGPTRCTKYAFLKKVYGANQNAITVRFDFEQLENMRYAAPKVFIKQEVELIPENLYAAQPTFGPTDEHVRREIRYIPVTIGDSVPDKGCSTFTSKLSYGSVAVAAEIKTALCAKKRSGKDYITQGFRNWCRSYNVKAGRVDAKLTELGGMIDRVDMLVMGSNDENTWNKWHLHGVKTEETKYKTVITQSETTRAVPVYDAADTTFATAWPAPLDLPVRTYTHSDATEILHIEEAVTKVEFRMNALVELFKDQTIEYYKTESRRIRGIGANHDETPHAHLHFNFNRCPDYPIGLTFISSYSPQFDIHIDPDVLSCSDTGNLKAFLLAQGRTRYRYTTDGIVLERAALTSGGD